VMYSHGSHDKSMVVVNVPVLVPFVTNAWSLVPLTGRHEILHGVARSAVIVAAALALCLHWIWVDQAGPYAHLYVLSVFFTVVAL
jgi:hypothetical protein